MKVLNNCYNPGRDNLNFVQILNQPIAKYNYKSVIVTNVAWVQLSPLLKKKKKKKKIYIYIKYKGESEGVRAVHRPETVKSHGGKIAP